MGYTLRWFENYLKKNDIVGKNSISDYKRGVKSVYESLFNTKVNDDDELIYLVPENNVVKDYLINGCLNKTEKNNKSYVRKYLECMIDNNKDGLKYKIDGLKYKDKKQIDNSKFDINEHRDSCESIYNILKFKFGVISILNNNLSFNLYDTFKEDIKDGYVIYDDEIKAYKRKKIVIELKNKEYFEVLEYLRNTCEILLGYINKNLKSPKKFCSDKIFEYVKKMRCLRGIFYSEDIEKTYFKKISFDEAKKTNERIYACHKNAKNVYPIPISSYDVNNWPNEFELLDIYVYSKNSLLGYATYHNLNVCNVIYLCEDRIITEKDFYKGNEDEIIKMAGNDCIWPVFNQDVLYKMVLAHELSHCLCSHSISEEDASCFINKNNEQEAQSLSSIMLISSFYSACIRVYSKNQPIEYQGMKLYKLDF